jgi:thiol-disulfide isomerase/thioredoxin/uncharacterized membrane protein YphA (DoxX/SURF4 family)
VVKEKRACPSIVSSRRGKLPPTLDTALLVCRLVLASVFIVAGLAKLADLNGTRRAVSAFGVPENLSAPVGVALPAAELAVGVALVPLASARFGAVAAAALLACFIGAVANALAHGKAPDCHCFGQVRSAPVGWRTLARNIVLLGVAGFVAIAGWGSTGLSATAWVANTATVWLVAIAAGLVILVLVFLQLRFWFQVLAQNGRMLARVEALERALLATAVMPGLAPDAPVGAWRASPALAENGLPIGAPAPSFELSSVDGERVSLDFLLARGRPLMLVFSDPGCGPCGALLPDLARWQRQFEERFLIAVIASGDREPNQVKASEHDLSSVLLDAGREVSGAYRAHGTPAAVVLGPDGLVLSPTVAGGEAIRRLVEQATGPGLMSGQQARAANGHSGAHPQPAPPRGTPRVGEVAPNLVLDDLEGRRVALKDLYHRPTLTIFWDPGCGFCQRMLPELKALEDALPVGAPQLVVISAGDPDSVRAQQVRSRVLLDPTRQAMRAFGAGGTPMGVLVDEQGHFASELLAGAPAVLAGARDHPQPVPAGG